MTNSYDRFNSWKGLRYYDKLEACLRGEKPYPVNWHVYISNICPYSCNFCIMSNRVQGVKLPNKTLDKIVEDSSRLGLALVHISGGGEPLTHDYINKFVSGLRSNGVKVALSTNGYFLERLEEVVDHLRISFNAGKRESYEKIHRANHKAYDKVINNIYEAVKNRKGKDIGMGFVLTHENYHEVDDFVKLAEDLGVDFVHIRPAFWPDKNTEIMSVVKKIKPRSDKVSVFCVSDKFAGYWDEDKHSCRATPLFAVTDATGEFLICQDRLDLRWGDYNKQSFEEIWNSPQHDEMILKAQDCNIRCVESGLNKMISEIGKNSLRIELL